MKTEQKTEEKLNKMIDENTMFAREEDSNYLRREDKNQKSE